jgi:hypothetical protein
MIVATPHAEIASTDLDNLTEGFNSGNTKMATQRCPVGYSGPLKIPNNNYSFNADWHTLRDSDAFVFIFYR